MARRVGIADSDRGRRYLPCSDITYAVTTGFGHPIGIYGATISGTVQTDGMTGILAASNLLNWTVIVTDGLGGSSMLIDGNSTLSVNGTALTATATALQFNFDTPNIGALGNFEIIAASKGRVWAFAVPPGIALELEQVLYSGPGPSRCAFW